jgi:chemotaxis protein methyltransferase CheR
VYRRPDGREATGSPASARTEPPRHAVRRPGIPARPARGEHRPRRAIPAGPAPLALAPAPAVTPVPAVTPAPAPTLLDEARAAAHGGDLEAAERMAREAAARDLSPEAYLLASMVADARGDVAAAVDAIRRALYLDPGLAMGHAALVPLYARLGLADESARARRNALEAIDGLDDGAPLRGVEVITAGALRSALGERAARAAGSGA